MTTPTIRSLYEEMIAFGKTNAEVSFTPASLTRVLRKFVGSDDIKLEIHRSTRVEPDQIIVNGWYDPVDDEENLSSITIEVVFNTAQKEIFIENMDWKTTCIDLIECVGHEIVHQTQYRLRKFDIRPEVFVSSFEDEKLRDEQEYLANFDEIEAYGYSIAVGIYLRQNPREITSKHVNKSQVFKMYATTFGATHPIVGTLLAYVLRYFRQLRGDLTVKTTKQVS